jgi:hypothetical protein
MTSTLVPPASAVARSDPQARLNDYIDALCFYLSLPNTVIDRILFVDNSASNLSPLIDVARSFKHDKDVEFISFDGNDHPPQRGKAYGEFKLIDYGLANTTLFGQDDIVWKTTGRLQFLNLSQMAKNSSENNFDFLCDLRNVPWVGSGKWHGYQNMELRVFAFRVRAYDVILRGLWHGHDLDFDAQLLYERMRQDFPGLRIVRRFALQPKLLGIGGRHQHDYRSPKYRAKDIVRSTLRRLIPWLWL